MVFENVTYSADPYDLTDEEAGVLLELELGVLAKGVVATRKEEA